MKPFRYFFIYPFLLISTIFAEDLIINGTSVYLFGEQNYDNVIIKNGGQLYLVTYGGTDGNQGKLRFYCDSLYLDQSSQINGENDGGYYGSGNGSNGSYGGSTAGYYGGGGGGGFGGAGGAGGGNNYGYGGGTYGSYNSLQRGSKGGKGYNNYDSYMGRGGGSLYISSRIANIFGTINFNGEIATQNSYTSCGGNGGGSGGMVWLEITNLNLTGTISANGGDGSQGSSTATNFGSGGGGGGGRISILTESLIDLDLLQVNGGEGHDAGNGYPGQDGEDGVIYYLKTWLTTATHPDDSVYYTNPIPVVGMEAAGDIFGYFYEIDQNMNTQAGQTSSFTSENELTLDSLTDGTWYIHAVPMDTDYEILDQQHSTYQFNISAGPPTVSSSTHPNQDYVYSNANPVINIAEVTGIESYYYIFDQSPTTVPDSGNGTLLNNNLIMFPDNPDGTYYFHAVAIDGVGHVGTNPAHFQVNIGDPSPEITVEPTAISFPNTIVGLALDDSVTIIEEYVEEFVSTNVPLNIENQSITTSDLTIDDNGTISDLNLTLHIDGYLYNINEISIVSPNGTLVRLTGDYISSFNMYYTTFDDEASVTISNGGAPYSGSYIPDESLTAFDGEEMLGTWQLMISETGNDNNTLESWSLEISSSTTETTSDSSIISREIEISNSGNGDLFISSIEFGNASDTSHFSLSPDLSDQSIATDGSAVFQVYFHPASIDTFNTSLSINTNDPDEASVIVTLAGVGESGPDTSVPVVTVSEDTIHFGQLYTWADSTVVLTIGNDGDADLFVSDMSLDLGDVYNINPFEIAGPISPGDAREIEVSFMPEDTVFYADTLRIETNDNDNPVVIVVLEGDGILNPPYFTVSSDTIDFGNVELGAEGHGLLRLFNNGADTLSVNLVSNPLTFNGFNASPDFAELPAYSSFDIDVYFTPLDTGLTENYITAYSNSIEVPQIIIHLSGTGVSGDTVVVPNPYPVIDAIIDMPQDQGGYVGIQFAGSAFDCCFNTFDITHYSIWRELDLALLANHSDDTNILSLPGTDNARTDSSYWEYLGETPAVGFENYGYTAETIMDSSETGSNWNAYLIIAHTPNSSILFISESDSGYSVDNIAPFPPDSIIVVNGAGSLTATWDVPDNPDLYYWEIYKNGELLIQTDMSEFEDTFGGVVIYTIRGIDIHGNVGEFSDPFEVANGILGDVTWDGEINVLDVLNMADLIMNGVDGISEAELWTADMNTDGTIDIFDLVQLVNYIMSGGSLARSIAATGETAIYHQGSVVYLSSSVPVYGLQLTLSGAVNAIGNQTNLVFHHRNEKVLLYSMGDQSLSGEKVTLFELPEGVFIETAKVSGAGGEPFVVTLGIIPESFAVYQNYPNPFNPATQLKIDLAEISHLNVRVYDAGGREIVELINKEMLPGSHQVTWNGQDANGVNVASGIYFFRIQTPANSSTIKAILLR